MDTCSSDSTFESSSPTVILEQSIVHAGIDLGTHTTVLAASMDGKSLGLKNDEITTVVGFPKKGILPGILPNDGEVMFGDEAVEHRLHLDLRWPLHAGQVEDVAVCQQLCSHLRGFVDLLGLHQIWGVVGAPANSSEESQKRVRLAMTGFLDRLLIVPEPFLAAMGLREEDAFRNSDQAVDPTRHSLIVDIGAGTTDFCLVRGYFPTAEDQISVEKAGALVDDRIHYTVRRRYPDLKLSRISVQKIKEKFSHVSGHEREAVVKVYVDGRPRVLDFSEMIQEACDQLLPVVSAGIRQLIQRCDSDSAAAVLRNIIITGGSSRIQGLCARIENDLHRDGYENARCTVPSDYRGLVANGALKIAESVREDQWQYPM